MKHLLLLPASIAAVLLLGCDPHIDSVYLGRAEGKMLGDVQSGDIAAVQEYLDKGGNVNLRDEPGMTPLHHAVNADWKESHLKMVKLLIERGADVKARDDTDHTPLHLASNRGTAGLLIDAGADVNARTRSDGETLLYSSARNAAQGASKSYQAYLDLVKLLVARGADVNVKLKTGDTTLHVVAQQFSEKHASEVCEFLIANGANLNEKNSQGRTPLDEAIANQRNLTGELLRKHGAKTAEELKPQGQ